MGNNISDLRDAGVNNEIDPLAVTYHSSSDFQSNIHTGNMSLNNNSKRLNNSNNNVNSSTNQRSTKRHNRNETDNQFSNQFPKTNVIHHSESSASSYVSDCSSCNNHFDTQHADILEFDKKTNKFNNNHNNEVENYTHRHHHHNSSIGSNESPSAIHDSQVDIFSDKSMDDMDLDDEKNGMGLPLQRFTAHPDDSTNSTNNPRSNPESGYSSRSMSAHFYSETANDASLYENMKTQYQQLQDQKTDHPEVPTYKSGMIHEFTTSGLEVREEYTSDIPVFYIPERIRYPYRSPYEYTDSEFDLLNHFDFLKTLNFKEPPLLPPYLSSNLLNDTASHNYKTYPYQYQQSNDLYVNDQYRYNINNLHIMDKYSKPEKDKRRASIRSIKTSNSPNISPNYHDTRRSDTQPDAMMLDTQIEGGDHFNSDYDYDQEEEKEQEQDTDIPNHVMLNHLITCNLKSDMNTIMTGSCIHRYGGKFITQIMYFSTKEVVNH